MSYGAADSTRQRFTSKERDTESGLDYFLARYYSAAQGRFASVDPENAGAISDDPQSWNGYAYARNNPLLYIDPTGLAYDFYVNGQWYRVNDATEFARHGYKVVGGSDDGNTLTIQDADGNQYTAEYAEVPVNRSETISGNFPDLPGPYRGVLTDLDRRRSASNTFITIVGVVNLAPAVLASITLSGGTIVQLGLTNPFVGLPGGVLNSLIGAAQREILKRFFGQGLQAALDKLANFAIPEGLTVRTLEIAREISIQAIQSGKDSLGTQAVRLKLIEKALEILKK